MLHRDKNILLAPMKMEIKKYTKRTKLFYACLFGWHVKFESDTTILLLLLLCISSQLLKKMLWLLQVNRLENKPKSFFYLFYVCYKVISSKNCVPHHIAIYRTVIQMHTKFFTFFQQKVYIKSVKVIQWVPIRIILYLSALQCT